MPRNKLTTTLKGDKRLERKLGSLSSAAAEEAQQIVDATALRVRNNAVRSIQKGPASGRVYEKYSPRRTHQASAPGQPPMTDTGQLAGSINIVTGTLRAKVGTPLMYGLFLEFGTRKMRQRPWLRPAFEKERGAFRDEWNAFVARIDGASG